MFCQKIQMS